MFWENLADLCRFVRGADLFGRTGTTASCNRFFISENSFIRFNLDLVAIISMTVRFSTEIVLFRFIRYSYFFSELL